MTDVGLTERQIISIKEVFSLFDKDDDGLVEIGCLGKMVRGLNQYPTNKDIELMSSEVDPNGAGYFDFPEFLSLMAKHFREIDAEEELANCLRYTDSHF